MDYTNCERMMQAEWQEGADISVFAIGATLLRNRWRIVRWSLGLGIITALIVSRKPALFLASAAFVSQGAEQRGSSGLASLAGQFGVAIPSGNATLSPDLYARLLKSRDLLGRVARDTIVVPELGGRVAMFDLLKVPAGPARIREERAIRVLNDVVTVSVSKVTGVVDVSALTRWPNVSLFIDSTLVRAVNEFHVRMRKEQAFYERRFVEGRLAIARTDLRAAEDRLAAFLQQNRMYTASSELSFQRDRLQREVALQQQVYTTLTQSYEDVRMREVRDTPVITMVEPASVPSTPQPRGRVMSVLLALVAGAVIGALLSVVGEGMRKRKAGGDAGAEDFAVAVTQAKREMFGRVRRLAGRP